MSIIKKGNILVSKKSSERLEKLDNLKEFFKENIDKMGPKWIAHLPLFLGAPELARILWLNEVYSKIDVVPGVVMEFGSQYGASFNVLNMIKLIHEPWNPSRKLLSFTTFEEGFVSVDKKDGSMVQKGDYGVEKSWEDVLNKVLDFNTMHSPVGPTHEIISGDVTKTLPKYLDNHPETVLAMAHFDLDVYLPTKKALEACLKIMPIGGILVFDELNHPGFPGETTALNEIMGISNVRIRKSKYQPYSGYIIKE